MKSETRHWARPDKMIAANRCSPFPHTIYTRKEAIKKLNDGSPRKLINSQKIWYFSPR
jgi:hypothetical protein